MRGDYLQYLAGDEIGGWFCVLIYHNRDAGVVGREETVVRLEGIRVSCMPDIGTRHVHCQETRVRLGRHSMQGEGKGEGRGKLPDEVRTEVNRHSQQVPSGRQA